MISKMLSTWASNIEPSPTLTVTAKAKALKAQGKDVCSFGAGEPDFDTPDFIKDACHRALDEGQTKYAPVPGLPALRDALAVRYSTFNGIKGLTAENTVISPGGKFSCYIAIMATISPGDEVIIPAPYWVSYPEMVKLAGGINVIVPTSDAQAFRMTPEQLENAITPRTRMVVLNSPSNPTGSVYSRKELEALTEIAIKHGIYILSDEIYDQLLYDGAQFHSPASFSHEAFEHTITVGGFSKSFSMTGWRLGTLVAPKVIAKAAADIQSQTSSNATTFAQFGALAALENTDAARSALASMLTAFDRRRQRLLDGLNAIPDISCYRSTGAFYLFPNVSRLSEDSLDFCARLLDEKQVAAVPGVAFGAEGYIRLSYACSDETIEKGLCRIAEFASSLRS